jgi:PAS domain S-box-containing protein
VYLRQTAQREPKLADDPQRAGVEQLLNTPDLANALESDRFKQFLDHVPVAIAVSELTPSERVVYANVEFERLTGEAAAAVQGRSWEFLQGQALGDEERRLYDAILQDQDYLGIFSIEAAGGTQNVNAWSNLIQDDDGNIVYRLVALGRITIDPGEFEQRIHDKDTLLRELQHRVKNNLQMITALIRIEARNVPDDVTGERFDRLAGRVESLALLYRSLADEGRGESIDLGVYLSQVATAVMRAHAVEGIHLNLQVDTWLVSINVAMPAGLVVNELLTNALKHAFKGREGGTITLQSLVDEAGCRVVVADDGIGLSDAMQWPQRGKLSAMIVQSLRQNAKATVEVETQPGKGLRVTVFFARADAVAAP